MQIAALVTGTCVLTGQSVITCRVSNVCSEHVKDNYLVTKKLTVTRCKSGVTVNKTTTKPIKLNPFVLLLKWVLKIFRRTLWKSWILNKIRIQSVCIIFTASYNEHAGSVKL